MKIALVGAGQMGWPMAQHLARTGHAVTVHYRGLHFTTKVGATGGSDAGHARIFL
jgi:3-hydroxyisobutyrate dehydrogenase-like beta-hydroxyacid dehydrogenase